MVRFWPAGGSVIGWIMNQARWKSLDQLKLRQRKKRSAEDSADGGLPASPNPADECEIREEYQRLQLALDALTPLERQAIETAFFSEMSYLDTAVKLNQPRAIALADIDGNGDADLVVTQLGGAPLVLRNEGGNQRGQVVTPYGCCQP